MDQQNIKPLVPVPRHVHPYAVTPKLEMHALVFDIANAVKSEVGCALTKEDRTDSYACALRFGFGVRDWEVEFAHVV